MSGLLQTSCGWWKSATARTTLTAMIWFAGIAGAVANLGNVEVRPKGDPEPPSGLQERIPLPKMPPVLPANGSDFRLMVKFVDAWEARVNDDGCLSVLEVPPSAELVNTLATRVAALNQVFREDEDPQGWEALIGRAEQLSGQEQADFFGIIEITPADLDPVKVLELAQKFNLFAEVEVVEIVALDDEEVVAIDYDPPTPDYEPDQTWRESAPGLDANYARRHNALGQGVRFIDIEQDILETHEDNALFYSYLQPSPRSGNSDHGTAVMSIVAAPDNGYGVTGIAPEVRARFISTRIDNVWRAVSFAARTADAGDIVLYEVGWDVFDDGATNADLLVTKHYWIWMLTRAMANSGIIVIEAAGNGNIDLDTATAGNLAAWRSRGPSGSIIVGAGSADSTHQKLGFSCYGSPVDVHAWGQSVVAAGYGDLFTAAPDFRQDYTEFFNGTSSASALVAGVASSLQSLALAHLGRKLGVEEMRSLLASTGIPQGGDTSKNIGPMVDLRGAIDSMIDPAPRFVNATTAYEQDFPLGTYPEGRPMPEHGWVIKAEPETARTRIFAGRLRMDTTSASGGMRLNEATLHLRLGGLSNVELRFDHRHSNDEANAMPGAFTGWADADGVAFSADGITWFRLTDFTGEPSDLLRTFIYDLDAAVAAAGLTYNDNFRIRFQQYGAEPWGADGREFDNIRVSVVGPGVFSIVNRRGDEVTEGDPAYVAVMRSSGASEPVTVDLRTSDHTATAGPDYEAVNQTLSFAVGEVQKTIAIETFEDTAREGREEFHVGLTNATGGASIRFSRSSVRVTILDLPATDWSRFRNAEPFEIPDEARFAEEGPAPDEIFVGAFLDRVVGLRVRLHGVTSPAPDKLHVWLVAPNGAHVLLMSGAAGFAPMQGTELTFDVRGLQGAPQQGPQDGSYQPLIGATPPDFIPQITGELGDFAGIDPTGSWKLFVVSTDSQPAALEGGWALSIVTAPYPELEVEGVDAGGNLELVFTSVQDAVYNLEDADDLAGWMIEMQGITATGPRTTVTVPMSQGEPGNFFRVEEIYLPPLDQLE